MKNSDKQGVLLLPILKRLQFYGVFPKGLDVLLMQLQLFFLNPNTLGIKAIDKDDLRNAHLLQ